ncbi:hypothetical protein [Rhodococcus rhodochrous]|uniref:hypothetical protein n=1 Tax=Rhodococcus rhodochrous TaxID=1829 RepID=UPI00188BB282|nr:hypothetical protein [Rhodococcus rhodochrous]MBF4479303.1 hypothetical protein [Rhodococcus rhodochrous]MCD2124815.1 hypothetical protein [Rhodococcus rhodochrous]MCQ4138184.1 hypothetical protein [Rhodococcus rhodochrous]
MKAKPPLGLLQPVQHGEQLLQQGVGAGFDLVEDVSETIQAVASLAARGNAPFLVV